jgi:hypothetical protein
MTLHQPFVHDLAGVFAAPVQAWSAPDGSMGAGGSGTDGGDGGAEGIFLGEERLVSRLETRVDGGELSPVSLQVPSATEVSFIDVVSVPGHTTENLLRLTRKRRARAADPAGTGVRETLTLRNASDSAADLVLRMEMALDATPMAVVKNPRNRAGFVLPALEPVVEPGVADGAAADGADDPSGLHAAWTWRPGTFADLDVRGFGTGEVHGAADGTLLRLELSAHLEPGEEKEAFWTLRAADPSAPFIGGQVTWDTTGAADAYDPAQEADALADAAERLLGASLSDLSSLVLAPRDQPEQVFLAAGAPWFLTLFGRDSLIAASFLGTLSPELVQGTLRVLADRQGQRVDPATAEQPGKILHELRPVGMSVGNHSLPPVYYGTIDATPLWIMLLREAQQNGLDVADLRPNLMAAARWLLEYADADGDGFLEYIDEAGTGLANQGWKDSGDSIRFADGTIADAPIALAEVQGYAYRAALDAASLLEDWADGGTVGEGEAEGSDLPASLRFWAENLRERFRDSFWCEDEAGRYVALALDGQKKSVDGVASNMGHLLGTGILEPAEARVVVDRLMSPEMFSGYGIRTLSTDNAAYWPQRYHGGSVWTHDTGYILRQMWRAGFTDEARVLARGLIRAADGFDQRLPELFSGEGPEFADPPIPYPASCRPQAWAAASAVVVAEVVGE